MCGRVVHTLRLFLRTAAPPLPPLPLALSAPSALLDSGAVATTASSTLPLALARTPQS